MRYLLVSCRNADGFHEDSEIEYLVYRSGAEVEVVRYPSFELIKGIIPKGANVKLLWKPCAVCRARGIKGFTHIPNEDMPLDFYEMWKEWWSNISPACGLSGKWVGLSTVLLTFNRWYNFNMSETFSINIKDGEIVEEDLTEEDLTVDPAIANVCESCEWWKTFLIKRKR